MELNSQWPLLAKYLVNEVTQEERLIVELMLKEDDDLRNDFQKLMAVYYLEDHSEPVNATQFFKKLNSRIKKN